MGIERTIYQPQQPFDWLKLVQRLKDEGEVPVLRMLDGMPAFPDEIPNDDWQELRIGLRGGMVTVRKLPDSFKLVTWGSPDADYQQSANRLYEAICEQVCGRSEP